MLLLELAAQAVRGFSPAIRVALRPGYVLLQSPSTAVSPVASLLGALAFPDGRGSDAAFVAPGSKAGKAGFSFQGNDQNAWRLVRELGGAGSLHKMVKGSSTFELVTQDSNEIAQMLRTTVGMPQKGPFEQVFVLSATQLPSRRPRIPKDGKDKPKPAAPKTPPDVLEARARIAELQKELVTSRQVSELQYRHDGLQSELFAVEERLKAHEQAKTALASAQAEVEGAPTLLKLGLAPDTMDKLKRLPTEQQRRDDLLARLEVERQQAEERALGGPQNPLWRDPRFMGAFFGGVLVLVVASMLDGYPRYLALLGVPIFGYAALAALSHIEELQAAARSSGRTDLFTAREKKVNDEFAAFAAQIKAILGKAGVENADDLNALLQRKADAEQRYAQAQATVTQHEQDPETKAALAKAGKVRAELAEIDQKMVGMSGGYVRDAREVERELAKLEEQLAPKLEPQDEFKPVETGPTELVEDPVPALLKHASDLFRQDQTAVWALLKDRCAQYLAALTDRRYHGMEIDRQGKASVLAPGRTVPLGECPPKDVDLIWLGLRLTLIEKHANLEKVPLVVEDGFAAAVDDKLPLLHRMLKHLGTQTQVLHVVIGGPGVVNDTALHL